MFNYSTLKLMSSTCVNYSDAAVFEGAVAYWLVHWVPMTRITCSWTRHITHTITFSLHKSINGNWLMKPWDDGAGYGEEENVPSKVE